MTALGIVLMWAGLAVLVALAVGRMVRLAECRHEACSASPTTLGWCEEHAPPPDGHRDEYWG